MDNVGFARVHSTLLVSGNVEVGAAIVVNGGIVLPATSRSRIVPACSWRPVASTQAYTTSNTDWITGTTASQSQTFFIPLDLPDGAIIREVTLFCDDSSSTSSITFSLRRVQSSGTSPVIVGSVASSGSPGNTSLSLTGLNDPTNANTIAHTLAASWVVPATPSQIRVGNVRVKYDITSPLP